MKCGKPYKENWKETLATALNRPVAPVKFFLIFFCLCTPLLNRATHFYVCCYYLEIESNPIGRMAWRLAGALGSAGDLGRGFLMAATSVTLSRREGPYRGGGGRGREAGEGKSGV